MNKIKSLERGFYALTQSNFLAVCYRNFYDSVFCFLSPEMKIKNPNTFEKAMELYKNMKPSNRYKVIDLYWIEDRFLTMDDAIFVTCSYRKKIKDMFKDEIRYEN